MWASSGVGNSRLVIGSRWSKVGETVDSFEHENDLAWKMWIGGRAGGFDCKLTAGAESSSRGEAALEWHAIADGCPA